MRRTLFILIGMFLILSPAARTQGGFTTVTGTITGPDGLVWACGTISAQLITAGGAAPTLNGGGFTTQTSPIGLGCPTTSGTGAPGSFAMRLADSGVINPSNTTWRFTVNMAPGIVPPAGTGPQSFTFISAINCSTNTPSTCTSNTIDISTQLSALAPKLSNGGGGSGTTVVTSNPGTCATNATFYNSTTGQFLVCSATNTLTAPQGSLGTGVFDPTTPPYNAFYDVKRITDPTIANGSPNLSCPNTDCGFVAGDATKLVKLTNQTLDTTAPTSVTCLAAGTTILSVTDASHVVLSNNSTCATLTATGRFAWGHDDTTAINAAWAAASLVCGVFYSPAGKSAFFSAPIFNQFQNPCTTSNGVEEARYGANITSLATGPGSFLIPLTGFSGAACTGGGSANICIGAGATALSNVSFDGMGESAIGAGFNGKNGIALLVLNGSNPQILNTELSAWGTATAGFIGLNMTAPSGGQVLNMENDGWGGINCQLTSTTSGQTVIDDSFCAVGLGNLSIPGGSVSSTNNIFGFQVGAGNNAITIGSSGSVTFNSVNDFMGYGTTGGQSQLVCSGGAGVTANINLVNDLISNPTAASFGLVANTASTVCNININNSIISSTTDAVFLNATATLNSNGGNQILGPISVNAASKTHWAETDIINTPAGILPTCTFSTGGGTTPSCLLQAGSTNEKGVIIASTGTGAPGSTGTVTLTFNGTFSGATATNPACTYTLDNSGTAWGNEAVVFVSTQSTTAPVVAWSNVATAVLTALATSSPYRIDYRCSAR